MSVPALGISTIALGVAATWLLWFLRTSAARGFWAGAVLAILMGIQWGLARFGLLARWDRLPPPLFFLMIGSIAVFLVFGFSRIGSAMAAKLSFAALIGLQTFRFPLELVMHRASTEGLMPVQMSYSGYNFDIVSGLTAIPVAWIAGR